MTHPDLSYQTWVSENCSMVQWVRLTWRLLALLLGSLLGSVPATNSTFSLPPVSLLLQSLSYQPPNLFQLVCFLEISACHLSAPREDGLKKASRRGTETAWEVGVSWFEKRKRCVQTMDPHLTGLLCGWIKINTHTHLIIIPSMPCVPDQAAHPISSAEETLASADRRPRGRLRLHLSRWQPSRSSAQTGLSLGQTRQQSLPFLWDWSGIERAVRKITPRREWWGWGPLGGGEKMMRDQSKVRKSISFSLQIYKFRGL